MGWCSSTVFVGLLILITITCQPPTSANFYSAVTDFQSDFGGWSQESDDGYNWIRTYGPSPTSGTGPTNGHSGYSDDYYAYIDSSSSDIGALARLRSPLLPKGRNLYVKFYYHMYGLGIGKLNVCQKSNNGYVPLWTKTDNQGNSWHYVQQIVFWNSESGDNYVVFEGIAGSSNTGDIAIDDISITEVTGKAITLYNPVDLAAYTITTNTRQPQGKGVKAIVSLGCFEINKLSRGFVVPPEDTDPSYMTRASCLISCARYDYDFAALEDGRFCLCSDTNMYDGLTPVATATYCNAPCTETGSGDCGGRGYCEVFESLNEAITVTLSAGVNFVVGTERSIAINATGYQLDFTFDFGDGSAVTEPTNLLTASHTYAIPGVYSVTCRAENGFLDGNLDVSEVQVDMRIDAAGIDLECPTVEDLDNEFEITLTVFEGSNMLLDVDMDGVTLTQFDIGSPAMYSLGFVAEGTRTDLEDGSDLNSGSTVWVLPGLEILQPGYILSVEAYVTTPGTVNLLILKPLCGGVDVYCPHNKKCVTANSCNYVFDYPSNPEYTEYCNATGVYCALSGTCQDSDNSAVCSVKNTMYDDASPRNDYEVVASIPVTFTKTNAYEYVKIPIRDIKGGVVAEIGYVIGYETTAAGIGWQNVTNKTIEYQYSPVSYGVGDTLAKSDATAFKVQHYIRVSTVKELRTIVTSTFSTYGDHLVTADITNDLGTEQRTCTVIIQQNITDLLLMMDNHTEVRSTEEATLFVWLQRGIPALLSIDWGDGATEEIDRISTSPDVPDKITHIFTASGIQKVRVNASNLWNWEVFELEITVYNPVDLATNTPQPKEKGVKGKRFKNDVPVIRVHVHRSRTQFLCSSNATSVASKVCEVCGKP